MSNWIPITPDNLSDYKVDALVQALRTAALGAGQDDPSPAIIQSVIDRIRAECAGRRTNAVDANLSTIPKSLYPLAIRMAIRALKDRLEIALTDDERKQWSSDDTYLARIARCEVPIDLPDNPIAAPVEPHAAIQLVSGPRRPFNEDSLRGLT